MASRIKAKSFTTRAEFDSALDSIAALQVQLRSAEAARDAEIQAVRDEHAEEIDDLKARLDAQAVLAEKYAVDHRAELFPGKLKSAETALANFGFRIGNPTLVLLNRKWSWESVLAAVKEAFPKRYVRVTEAVDKDALKAHLDGSQLAAIGCRIAQAETFYVEAKEQPSEVKAA